MRFIFALYNFGVYKAKIVTNSKQKCAMYFPEKGCHLGTNRSDNET